VTEISPTRRKLAYAAVALAAVWLLTGALAKLVAGNPMAMPPAVRANAPFGLDLTYHLVIAIELSLVALALLRPRWGWMPLVGLFGFFVVLLVPMVAAGEASCGCMGDSITFPPALMLAIDGALLAFLLATRPWVALRGPGSPWIAVGVAIAACWAAPWVVIRSADGGPSPAGTNGGQPAPEARYVVLEPERWIGRNVFEVEQLTSWVAPETLPLDGSIVIWRQGCDHCAAHLRKLAAADDGSRQLLLVQVRDDLSNARAVDALPQGGHVGVFAFPENLQGAVETPCEVRVEGGVVTAALYEKDFGGEGD
jgi:hypothetical protein